MVDVPELTLSRAPSLFERLTTAFQPEPHRPMIADPVAAQTTLKNLRLQVFTVAFFGYAILYFGRKNISAALPALASDLGYLNVEVGFIGTTLYVTYGLGKFLNGILADRANIRRFMATGLIVSGLINVAFSSFASLWFLAFAWGMNGWFQSMGFPPIARAMTLWYPPQGKATRWALWTCSHQAGTWAIMAFSAWLLTLGDWRLCFIVPGILCTLAGVAVLLSMPDTPESRGLPSAQAFAEAPEQAQVAYISTLIHSVLLNRNVWILGLIDLCVYAIRFGTLDWTTKFLVEHKGYSLGEAAFRAGMMPAAGVVGVLILGWVCDHVFGGRYRTVNAICLAGLGCAMAGFFWIGSDHPYLDLLLMACIGFFVEGPQSILGGVGAIDAGGSARVASAAAGLVGILSYFGASLSGVGTGFCIDHYGWRGAYLFWIAMSVVGFLLCVFLWRERPANSGHRSTQ